MVLDEDLASPAEEALLLLAEETLAVPEAQTIDSLVRVLVESVEQDRPDLLSDRQTSERRENPAVAESAGQALAAVGETEVETLNLAAESGRPETSGSGTEAEIDERARVADTQNRSGVTEPQLAAVLLDREDSESLWEAELDDTPGAAAVNGAAAAASTVAFPEPAGITGADVVSLEECPGCEPAAEAESRLIAESEAGSAEPEACIVPRAGQCAEPELRQQGVAVPRNEEIPAVRPEPLLLAAAPAIALLAAPVSQAVGAPIAEENLQPEPSFELTATPQLEAAAAEEAAASGSESLATSENQLALEFTAAPEALNGTDEAKAAEKADAEHWDAVSFGMRVQAEVLLGSIEAEANAARAAEQAGIGAIAASFSRRAAHCLLSGPAELVRPPAPPVFEWIRAARPTLQPLKPPPANLAALTARPETPPLAGPCLTPQLRNVADSRRTKASGKPGALGNWAPSLMGGTLLVILIGISFQYLSVQSDAKSSAPAVSQNSATAPVTADALARSVEISGLRLVKSWNGKQQVRFLIINHSTQDLSGVTLQVGVKASEAAGGGPILTIRAPIRSLAAYQSKEIKTDLDSEVPDSALADWESVRTDVQILKE